MSPQNARQRHFLFTKNPNQSSYMTFLFVRIKLIMKSENANYNITFIITKHSITK